MKESEDQNNSKDKNLQKLDKEVADSKKHRKNSEEQKLLEDEHEGQQLLTEERDTELINNLTEEIKLMQDKLLRAVAESENIRSRMNKKVEEARDYSIVGFAKDLLPVIDNFSRALSHVPANINDDTKIIIDGVRMIKEELISIFKNHGIESIEPKEGEGFDYNNHHAISQIATDQYEEGTIVSTMQVGYKIKDRLLRPASVAVAKK